METPGQVEHVAQSGSNPLPQMCMLLQSLRDSFLHTTAGPSVRHPGLSSIPHPSGKEDVAAAGGAASGQLAAAGPGTQ